MKLEYVIDFIGIVGLLMLAYGLYLISVIHMFLGVGALLVLFAMLAARKVKAVPGARKSP